jgi:putative acetyltransferase
VQALRGPSEVQLFGDSNEIAQMANLDVTHIHISIILIRLNKILDVWQRIGDYKLMTVAMSEQKKTGALVLRTFQPGDEKPFKDLNEIWISQSFALEPADHEVLGDPKVKILEEGGEICIAELDGEVAGCCALLVIGKDEYELAKMTVAGSARGHGVGRRLLEFAIGHARKIGARRLYLESNTKAADAIHLYEEIGFRHMDAPDHASKYARADTYMEMFL